MSRHDNDFAADRQRASAAGRKGAATVRERLGAEWLRRIGKAGGAAIKRKYGTEHYRAIGQKGGRSRWDAERKREAAPAASDSVRAE